MIQELILSFLRMFFAYIISLIIAYTTGYLMAKDIILRRLLLPVIDVLQSVPILTFFPIALFIIINFLPEGINTEVAVVFLIITSMVWNLIFAVYESFISFSKQLEELALVYKMSDVSKFLKMYLPYSLFSVIPNSQVSWANGWYFLIATEIISIGSKKYILKGIGSYLMLAAININIRNIILGLLGVTSIILFMNIFIWRPILSILSSFLSGKKSFNIYSHLGELIAPYIRIINPFYVSLPYLYSLITSILERFLEFINIKLLFKYFILISKGLIIFFTILLIIGGIYSIYYILNHPLHNIGYIIDSFILSNIRIFIALLLSILWTIPVAYLVVKYEILDSILVPIFEIAAAIPVAALFPVVILFFYKQVGFETAAIIFLMTGMQWYIFFNVYGAFKSYIEKFNEFKKVFKISTFTYWRKILLPAIIPTFLVGIISAIGGGWNAVIVAEYIESSKGPLFINGIGTLMKMGAETGNLSLMFISALLVGIFVPLLNKLVFHPLLRKYAEVREL